MPTISMSYGILIRMFFYKLEKRKMPHVHAEYQGQVAVYAIPDGTVLAGEIPIKNTSWLSRAKNLFQFEGWTNEYY